MTQPREEQAILHDLNHLSIPNLKKFFSARETKPPSQPIKTLQTHRFSAAPRSEEVLIIDKFREVSTPFFN
ncbi:hypothetical protein [Wohlfahrtiimonas chitiniclastica]|uniref:hypothetical protein n=1 Tax=Wohlfahrtiimonas chitiniclastica TaxID=400946 RepID=UPI0012DDAC23|nr:hypothetical protein [Wohlfahrtiimonas chitiniclastica]